MRSSILGSDAASRAMVAAPRRSLARSPLFVGACGALLLMIAIGLFAAFVAPFSPTAIDAAHVFQGPSPRHPFGTDRFGRDLLSRLVFAVRVSLGRLAILVSHILPNVVSPIVVQTAVCLSYGILIESALSYLGLGVQPPTPSWGTILNEGKEFLAQAPWVSLFPGGAIMLAVLAFNVIGDGLRDALDPRSALR